jgi:hypothetical protein
MPRSPVLNPALGVVAANLKQRGTIVAAEHQVRIAHTEDGHRAECATCAWRSGWHQSREVAEFHAMRHADDPPET